jgi:hypothetical protein
MNELELKDLFVSSIESGHIIVKTEIYHLQNPTVKSGSKVKGTLVNLTW